MSEPSSDSNMGVQNANAETNQHVLTGGDQPIDITSFWIWTRTFDRLEGESFERDLIVEFYVFNSDGSAINYYSDTPDRPPPGGGETLPRCYDRYDAAYEYLGEHTYVIYYPLMDGEELITRQFVRSKQVCSTGIESLVLATNCGYIGFSRQQYFKWEESLQW